MSENLHRPGQRARVSVDDATAVGSGHEFLVIAGPCAVESPEQILRIARGVAAAGAGALRGGAFKPRTSPYSFQGLGYPGLALLAEARLATGLPIVTEVLDARDVEAVASAADVLQIGARNMGNAALLREAAAAGVPVLLKRGFGATVQDMLSAADYLLAEGNEDVILCERGIRTFEPATRYTLDISAVPVLRARTHLPVIVDPSHAAGDSSLVPALALAAAAAGADGLLLEVHDQPQVALSDGDQSLRLSDLPDLMSRLRAVAEAVAAPSQLPAPVPRAAALGAAR